MQSNTDRKRIRVRARRLRDLESAFPGRTDYLDLSETDEPFDYRWHLDIARGEWLDFLAEAAMDVDYTSHVKNVIAANDRKFEDILMRCWSELYKLQKDDDDDWDIRPEALPTDLA